MDLALKQERVDGAAEIVDDGIALDYDAAGIGIDLDLGDVAAVGEGLSWRYAVMRRVEPRLHACRQFRRIARRLRPAKTSRRRSVPGTLNSPSAKRASCAETSRRCAASCVPLSMMVRPAS